VREECPCVSSPNNVFALRPNASHFAKLNTVGQKGYGKQMRYNEYSHRHGKELLQVLHPDILEEVQKVLKELEPFRHGAKKGKTVKEHISEVFRAHGWEGEPNRTRTTLQLLLF